MIYNILLILFGWWFCGVINTIAYQILDDEADWTFRHCSFSVLLLTFGLGPGLTAIVVLCVIAYIPVKYGTALGRTIARKIESARE